MTDIATEGIASARRKVCEHLIHEMVEENEYEFGIGDAFKGDGEVEYSMPITRKDKSSSDGLAELLGRRMVGEIRLLDLGSRCRIRLYAATEPPSAILKDWIARPDLVQSAIERIHEKFNSLNLWSQPLLKTDN